MYEYKKQRSPTVTRSFPLEQGQSSLEATSSAESSSIKLDRPPADVKGNSRRPPPEGRDEPATKGNKPLGKELVGNQKYASPVACTDSNLRGSEKCSDTKMPDCALSDKKSARSEKLVKFTWKPKTHRSTSSGGGTGSSPIVGSDNKRNSRPLGRKPRGSRASKNKTLVGNEVLRELDRLKGENVVLRMEGKHDRLQSVESQSDSSCPSRNEGDSTDVMLSASSDGRIEFCTDNKHAGGTVPLVGCPGDPPDAPPLLDDGSRERALKWESVNSSIRGCHFHYYEGEGYVKRRVQVDYLRHRTVPRYRFVDLRNDQTRMVALKHEDPIHAWFKISQVDCIRLPGKDLKLDVGNYQNSVVEVSYEYLVQLLGPGVFNLTYDSGMTWDRITNAARGLATVNINRYTPPIIVGHSVALAQKFCIWMSSEVKSKQGFRKPQGYAGSLNTGIVQEKWPYRKLGQLKQMSVSSVGIILSITDAVLCGSLWGIMSLGQVFLKLARRTWPQLFPELQNVWPVLSPLLMNSSSVSLEPLSELGVRNTSPLWHQILMFLLRAGLLPLIILRRARRSLGENTMTLLLMVGMFIRARTHWLRLLQRMRAIPVTSILGGYIRVPMPSRSVLDQSLNALKTNSSTLNILLSTSRSLIGLVTSSKDLLLVLMRMMTL